MLGSIIEAMWYSSARREYWKASQTKSSKQQNKAGMKGHGSIISYKFQMENGRRIGTSQQLEATGKIDSNNL